MINYILNKLKLLKWKFLGVNVDKIISKETVQEKISSFSRNHSLGCNLIMNIHLLIVVQILVCTANIFPKIAKANVKIFAFEPRIDIFKILSSNLESYKNTICELLALGDKNCTTNLYLNASHAKNSLTYNKLNIGFPVQPVYCVSLDSYFSDVHKLNNIFFLKIDVEGHGYFVLKGAKHIINHNKPYILCVKLKNDIFFF